MTVRRIVRRNKSSVADLLILSHDLFMIDGGEDNVVYRITGEKDFSALFE